MKAVMESWQSLLRAFKEKLAERLWAIPSISESEKEVVFREYLLDMDRLERALIELHQDMLAHEKKSQEENDLLRSLLGVPGDELKTRILGMTHDVSAFRQKGEELEEEVALLKTKLTDAQSENSDLRRRLKDVEGKTEQKSLDHLKLREGEIKSFSESHERLKNQVLDLESRLSNLRELFADSNKALATAKQEEILLLQKKLLDEMEATLKQKQQLSWAEEELFAKGVAQKVRTALVSAQGQLFLSLERLGLLDPESKTESFWKARWKMIVDGVGDLSRNFRSVQTVLGEVTEALDNYLHLTNRRKLAQDPVGLVELIKKIMADVYVNRRPTLSLEFMADDPMPSVRGDGELLAFVFRSLLQNALDALPNGSGKIIISLKNRSDHGEVECLIRDSGGGIPDHLVPRLFQPFFTTKTGHQGLSLSRSKRYVELHGGTLDLIETTATGTLFQVRLRLRGV